MFYCLARQKFRSGVGRACRAFVSFSILYISVPALIARAAEGITVPDGASDSSVCSIVERVYARGIESWRSGNLPGALAAFTECEAVLIKKSLWSPPKLPEKITADKLRSHIITNQVIFSLAALHQKMGRRSDMEKYVRMARERGILPRPYVRGGGP